MLSSGIHADWISSVMGPFICTVIFLQRNALFYGNSFSCGYHWSALYSKSSTTQPPLSGLCKFNFELHVLFYFQLFLSIISELSLGGVQWTITHTQTSILIYFSNSLYVSTFRLQTLRYLFTFRAGFKFQTLII